MNSGIRFGCRKIRLISFRVEELPCVANISKLTGGGSPWAAHSNVVPVLLEKSATAGGSWMNTGPWPDDAVNTPETSHTESSYSRVLRKESNKGNVNISRHRL